MDMCEHLFQVYMQRHLCDVYTYPEADLLSLNACLFDVTVSQDLPGQLLQRTPFHSEKFLRSPFLQTLGFIYFSFF